MPFGSVLSFLFVACSTPDAVEAADVPVVPAPPTSTAAKPLDCDLLEEAEIAEVMGGDVATVASQPVEEHRGRKLCAWLFDGGRVDVQLSPPPSKNVDGWGARMIRARLDKGFEAVDGLGTSAAWSASENQVFWHHGDTVLLHVSAGADRPGVSIPREKLRSLADKVDAAYRR